MITLKNDAGITKTVKVGFSWTVGLTYVYQRR